MNEPEVQPEDDSQETWKRDAFGFLQMLATELSEGMVQLPSYPEVALRVQRMLMDENVSTSAIVRAISVEPALSMQMMRMANSAALNATGEPVRDLSSAIQLIGYNMVRAAALSFVMQQLRNTEGLMPLRQRLNQLWLRGVTVGSVCRCVAWHSRCISPDAALLVGLLHGVGKLYILTRLRHLPQLLERPEAVEKILSDWHGNVGRSLLENWSLPEEFGAAIGEFEDPERDLRGPLCLTDVLAVGQALADYVPATPDQKIDEAAFAATFLQHERLFRRLAMDAGKCLEIARQALPEAERMRSVVGY